MNFNEKLIELRKKQGLSQEELGYKLNVTRQTVSKWELGQTTPEMDKLKELGKIFNVSVDELVNETEIKSTQNTVIEDQVIENEKKHSNKIVIIVMGILIVVIVFIMAKFFSGFFSIFNNVTDIQKNMFNNAENTFVKVFDVFNQVAVDTEQNDTEEIENMIENTVSKMEVHNFNISFESYSGTSKGTLVISALDKIIASNKKEVRKITVKYNETETQNEEEIKNIKRNIERFDDYELFFEYDADGFINKAIIEKI